MTQDISNSIVSLATRDYPSFPVDSRNQVWQNSGVPVQRGDRVTIATVEGETWTIGGPWGYCDARGYRTTADPGAGQPIFHKGDVDFDWHWGALICAIGDTQQELSQDSRQREVGFYCEFTSSFDGNLYFLCNDNPSHPVAYTDNSGTIHARVSIR